MTNYEIISVEAILKGYDYDGENIKTFMQWKEVGMKVKKGEKAYITTQIWKPKKKSQIDKEEKEENPNANRNMILVKAHLFTIEQVEPIENKEAAHSPTKVCGLPQ